MRARMSPLPVAKSSPCGLGATEMTRPSQCVYLRTEGIQELTGILVTLEHQLAVSGAGVPELHAPVFRSAEHPLSIRCERNAEHEVLVSLKSPRAPSTSSHLATQHAAILGHQLPHLDRLIQTSTDQAVAIWREGNAVDTIRVAINSLKSTNEVSSWHTPDTNALVQRSGCNEVPTSRDSHSSDAIFNLEGQDLTIAFNIPDTDGMVSAAGGDIAAVTGEVK